MHGMLLLVEGFSYDWFGLSTTHIIGLVAPNIGLISQPHDELWASSRVRSRSDAIDKIADG